MGHEALSTLHPDDHGTGVLSTLPCPDVLSKPNTRVLDKSLDRVSRAIIIHIIKSMLDGTLLSHVKQLVMIYTPPSAERIVIPPIISDSRLQDNDGFVTILAPS